MLNSAKLNQVVVWHDTNTNISAFVDIFDRHGFEIHSHTINQFNLNKTKTEELNNISQVELFLITKDFSFDQLDAIKNYIDVLKNNDVYTIIFFQSQQATNKLNFKSNWTVFMDEGLYEIESICLSLVHLLNADKLSQNLVK